MSKNTRTELLWDWKQGICSTGWFINNEIWYLLMFTKLEMAHLPNRIDNECAVNVWRLSGHQHSASRKQPWHDSIIRRPFERPRKTLPRRALQRRGHQLQSHYEWFTSMDYIYFAWYVFAKWYDMQTYAMNPGENKEKNHLSSMRTRETGDGAVWRRVRGERSPGQPGRWHRIPRTLRRPRADLQYESGHRVAVGQACMCSLAT